MHWSCIFGAFVASVLTFITGYQLGRARRRE